MQRLTIRHETRYDYDRAVRFTAHRLLVRPRDSHALRLIHASLELSPPGEVRWMYDALGNCVCLFTPEGEAAARTPAEASPISGALIGDPGQCHMHVSVQVHLASNEETEPKQQAAWNLRPRGTPRAPHCGKSIVRESNQ